MYLLCLSFVIHIPLTFAFFHDLLLSSLYTSVLSHCNQFSSDSLLQVMQIQSLQSYRNQAVPAAALLFVYVDRANSLPVSSISFGTLKSFNRYTQGYTEIAIWKEHIRFSIDIKLKARVFLNTLENSCCLLSISHLLKFYDSVVNQTLCLSLKIEKFGSLTCLLIQTFRILLYVLWLSLSSARKVERSLRQGLNWCCVTLPIKPRYETQIKYTHFGCTRQGWHFLIVINYLFKNY